MHTATPWEIGGGGGGLGLWITGPDKSANVICDLVPRKRPSEPEDEDYANAQFICRAVNSHDALVEALKGVSIMLNTALVSHESEPWAIRVREAIALTESEK